MSKYILNGTEYTLDDITKFANDLEISVEEYISDNGIEVVEDIQEPEEVISDPPKASASEKAEVVEEIKTPEFTPHPDGDAYYEALAKGPYGILNKEVADYAAWKAKNKPGSKAIDVANELRNAPEREAKADYSPPTYEDGKINYAKLRSDDFEKGYKSIDVKPKINVNGKIEEFEEEVPEDFEYVSANPENI